MPVGKVKWFDGRKGFGFVLDSEGRDVFVHFSVITGDGFRSLEEGEDVEYEVEQGPKGLLAKNVRRLNPPKTPEATPVAEGAVAPAATVGADATATPAVAAVVAEAPAPAAVAEAEPRPMRQPQPQFQPQHQNFGGGGGGYQKFGKKQKNKNKQNRQNNNGGRGQQQGQRQGGPRNVNGNVATPVREGAQPYVPNQPAANVAGAMERYLERMKRSWGVSGR